MYRSLPSLIHRTDFRSSILAPVALLVALSATAGVNADYQQTLAARGADAFTQPTMTVEINNDALAETFASNMVEANPALSDQEVMVDLQTRMQAEQRLDLAAANLEPASAAVVTEPAAERDASATAPDVAQTGKIEDTPSAVASR